MIPVHPLTLILLVALVAVLAVGLSIQTERLADERARHDTHRCPRPGPATVRPVVVHPLLPERREGWWTWSAPDAPVPEPGPATSPPAGGGLWPDPPAPADPLPATGEHPAITAEHPAARLPQLDLIRPAHLRTRSN